MIKHLKPYINIGPGQIIKREMDALNWSQKDLAEIIEMSPKSISLIINNKQSITVDTARLLAKAFDTSPEFWLNLEQNYRLRKTDEFSDDNDTATKAKIRKYMPILEMKKKGWIEFDKSVASQTLAYCSFWGIQNIDFTIYEKNKLKYCVRQAKNNEQFTNYYTLTWFHKANIEASKIKVAHYSKAALQKLAKKIPKFTIIENGISLFLNELYKTGIKVFVLSHLSKTYLDGATFFDKENPVIVYTARYNRFDNFWWTFAHEIAHILLHLNNNTDCYIDEFDNKSVSSKEESEANKLAEEILEVDKLLKYAEPNKHYMAEHRLIKIARSCGLDPSVVLGMLQYNGYVSYRTLSNYKKTVLDLIPNEYKKG